MHTHKYIHWVRTCTHCLICLVHFIHTHIGSSSSLVRTPLTTIFMAIHVSVLSSRWFSPLSTSQLSSCLSSSPFFYLSDEQQPELNQKIVENLRYLRDQRVWGHLRRPPPPHRLWAQRPWPQRAPELIGPPPGRGWRDTRRDAHSGTPRTSRLLRTRRRVSQSVVVVTVR